MNETNKYDPNKTELSLWAEDITEIKGLDILTQLQDLDLSHNEITEIKGLDTLTQLQNLNLSYNQITGIKGLPMLKQLRKLYLNDNQITEIKGLETLTQLQNLDLSYNQITTIKGLVTLTQLRKLNLYNNKLTEIKGLATLTQLRKLDLSINKIIEIKGIETLTQLQKLNLSYNQIKEIKGLETLTLLKILGLYNNQISEIKGLYTLTQLQTLYLSGNQLTEIPFTIMMCRRLQRLVYDNGVNFNPNIINVDPIILRFLNRNNIRSNNINVYNDSQNIHDPSINKSITESIYCIMQETKADINATILSEIVHDNILNELTKKSLIEYSNIESVHSTLNITFKELLTAVWNIIKKHKNGDEIKEVLNAEMQDSLCKCFTGRLSRLVNCLNGFDNRVQVKISEADEITNIIIVIRNKYENDIETQRLEVTKELTSRAYEKQTIDEWLSYLE